MIAWIKGLLGAIGSSIAAFVGGYILGKKNQKQDELERLVKAANARTQIEDNTAKLSPLERRRMLNKWSVSGVQADKADDER